MGTSKRKSGYRGPASYHSTDPEKRAKQLQNLRPGRRKGALNVKTIVRIERQALESLTVIEFAGRVGLDLHPAQEVTLRGIYGLPMTEDQETLFQSLAVGREEVPTEESRESLLCLGARSGKTTLAVLIALFESICRAERWRSKLGKGERAYWFAVGPREKTSTQLFIRNAARLLEGSDLAGEIDAASDDQLLLKNGLALWGIPCTSTAARGFPCYGLCADELAWFRHSGVWFDAEILESIEPRQAQFWGGYPKRLLISTPRSKGGEFWRRYSEPFGRLVIQGATEVFNPMIPREFLEEMRLKDPDGYKREFMAEFCENLSTFFPLEPLERSFTLAGDSEPVSGVEYIAGVDQSGLSDRGDRFGFAVSHKGTDGRVTVDLVRSWRTSDADEILTEIGTIAQTYKVRRAFVDRYGGGWIRAALEKVGLEVELRPHLPTVYANLKTLIVSSRIDLPDHEELREGLRSTQAAYSKGGNLSILHDRTDAGGHGDLADAVATSVFGSSGKSERPALPVVWVPTEQDFIDFEEKQRERDNALWDTFEPVRW